MDIRDYNRQAWDRKVAEKSLWTVPVDTAVVEAARRGDWKIILTPSRAVPRDWFGDLEDCDLLCLASGGGQLNAGFILTGFYEDDFGPDIEDPISDYLPTMFATRALKPRGS